ncbi:hypothetical protein D3C80_1615430 [compost metagenome]
MQLHGGAAVFQLIGFFHRGERQFAFLADGHKADVELVGHHGPQDETACIQAGDHIGAQGRVHVAVDESVDQHAKDLGVLQQGRDVAELHARRGPVGHGAYVLPEVVVDGECEHGKGDVGGRRRQDAGVLQWQQCKQAGAQVNAADLWAPAGTKIRA